MPGPEVETPRELLDFDAIRLFVDRVRQQDQHFTLDQDTAAAVTEICRRLDGIPLALELAAARAGQVTLTEICERLDERFRLLTDGGRATLPRHQTLQSMIDWSYDLLTAAEQRALSRCSVFAGSFDLSAADAVCTPGGEYNADVFDEVSALCAKSLIERSVDSGRTRFRLLESVRHYADIRLATDSAEYIAG
jgi:predicted ATPase